MVISADSNCAIWDTLGFGAHNSVKAECGWFPSVKRPFFSPLLRLCRVESNRPNPPAEVLLVGDPHAGPDVEVGGSSWKTNLLSRFQTQQVRRISTYCIKTSVIPLH